MINREVVKSEIFLKLYRQGLKGGKECKEKYLQLIFSGYRL